MSVVTEAKETLGYRDLKTFQASGIRCINGYPTEWDIQRTKNLFRLVCEPATANNDFELLSVYTDIGVRPRKDLEERGNRATTTDGYWKVKKGDLIVNKILAWMGAMGMSNYDGVTSPAYDILRPRKNLNVKYYDYLFRCGIMFPEFRARSKGIMDMRLRLYFDQFGQIPLPVPPRSEQDAIVAFLDRKLEEIDRFIANKRRLIELLEEERQRELDHLMTTSHIGETETQPTGNPCFPTLPKSWTYCRVKHASQKISKGDTPSNFGQDFDPQGEVRFIKIENIGDGSLIETPIHRITLTTHNMIQRSHLRSGDLVYAIAGATTGKVAIVRDSHLPANTNQAVAFIRPNGRASSEFLALWLRSPKLKEHMWLNTVKSAQPNLSMEELGNLPIGIPSLEEQVLIVSKAAELSAATERAAGNANKEISLMNEFRTSLIAEAVTGKIQAKGYAQSGGSQQIP